MRALLLRLALLWQQDRADRTPGVDWWLWLAAAYDLTFVYLAFATLWWQPWYLTWLVALAAHISSRRRISAAELASLPIRVPGGAATSALAFLAICAARGIAVVIGAAVVGVEAGRLLLDGCPPIESDEIVPMLRAP